MDIGGTSLRPYRLSKNSASISLFKIIRIAHHYTFKKRVSWMGSQKHNSEKSTPEKREERGKRILIWAMEKHGTLLGRWMDEWMNFQSNAWKQRRKKKASSGPHVPLDCIALGFYWLWENPTLFLLSMPLFNLGQTKGTFLFTLWMWILDYLFAFPSHA